MANKPEKNIDNLRDETVRQIGALLTEWHDEGFEDVVKPIHVADGSRHQTTPPPQPKKTKYNPDGIVDVITFCEHPYYLGQKLYPWQRLILKMFYSGIEGNTDAEINNDAPTASEICNGCVWQYIKEDEIKVNTIRQEKNVKVLPIMQYDNSPCLKCTRFDDKIRTERYEANIADARRQKDEIAIRNQMNQARADFHITERGLLNSPDFDQECRSQVEQKWGEKFQELVLVLGRRSGKSFMVSVIALYEVYRLLMMTHPQARYNLTEFDEIFILNVAVSEQQAKDAIFSKIKSMAISCPFFDAYRDGDPLEKEIRFLTPHDIEENKQRLTRGNPKVKGTVIIRCGHSNAAGMVGLTTWIVILDEVAAMAGDNLTSGLDYRLYEDMKPATATFNDDGKVLLLSNPKGPVGLLYDLYTTRMLDDTTLLLRLPTWQTNPNIGARFLANEQKKDPNSYPMQYGAEFGATSQYTFLDPDLIDAAFDGPKMSRLRHAQPLVNYFLHIDPASNSDYYAIAVAHLEDMRDDNGKIVGDKLVCIDHIAFWKPKINNQPIDPDVVKQYILELHNVFKFTKVTYDQWNSIATTQALKAYGMRCYERSFNPAYEDSVYQTLKELLEHGRLNIYNMNSERYDPDLRQNVPENEIEETKTQLKNLQKKWSGKRYKIEARSGFHDDIADCIAAVAHEALSDKVYRKLAKPQAVRISGHGIFGGNRF